MCDSVYLLVYFIIRLLVYFNNIAKNIKWHAPGAKQNGKNHDLRIN